jgi:hypothetical protein
MVPRPTARIVPPTLSKYNPLENPERMAANDSVVCRMTVLPWVVGLGQTADIVEVHVDPGRAEHGEPLR